MNIFEFSMNFFNVLVDFGESMWNTLNSTFGGVPLWQLLGVAGIGVIIVGAILKLIL